MGKRQPPPKQKPKPKADKPQAAKPKETKAEIRARVIAAFRHAFGEGD